MTSIENPRMRGFGRLMEVSQLRELIRKHVRVLDCEVIPLAKGLGRILGSGIQANTAVPRFDRAAMDGWAVHGEETFGAAPYAGLRLRVIGEARAGHGFSGEVGSGETVRVMTGAPLPVGTDAVLPAEDAVAEEGCLPASIEVQAVVTPGQHVGRRGEDIKEGEQILPAGRRLRPQDIGVLASLGLAKVSVQRRPRVAILATGDELLPAGEPPRGALIADANTPMLTALIQRDGAQLSLSQQLPDDPQSIADALLQAPADIVLISGGSSVGVEDHAPQLLRQHGKLLSHGVAMRPSSPSGFGTIQEKSVFLLPGNPVSCLAAYDFFAGMAVALQQNTPHSWPYPTITLPLAHPLPSVLGRLDYARIQIQDHQASPIGTRGASRLSSTSHADGFSIVPPAVEGFHQGQAISVYLYQPLPLKIV